MTGISSSPGGPRQHHPPPASDSPIVLNGRVLSAPVTGVQRYVGDLLPHLDRSIVLARPRRFCHGMAGHVWEQAVLPALVGRRLLWSPSNTGPLGVAKQVVTIHDVVPLDHPEWLNPRFAAWYRFLLPRLVRRVRHVIAISEFTRARLLATTRLEPSRISVIWHGLDPRFQPQPREAIDAVRSQLGLPPGRYVLSLGSLEPRKNLTMLLAAWERLLPALPEDLSLVIAGGAGSSLVFARRGVPPPRQRAVFLGHVPDPALPALYGGAWAFSYLSFYEGFGWPPLEAMACGTPVLASNTTVFPEILGNAALLTNPWDLAGVAEALEGIIMDESLRGRLRQMGPARAAQFGWPQAAARTGQILAAFS